MESGGPPPHLETTSKMKTRTPAHTILALLCLTVFCVQAPAQTGRELVEASGVKGGLIVCLGKTEGMAIEELRLSDSYLVQGLLTDTATVAAERKRLQAKGCYGTVSVRAWNGKKLPYIDKLINLVVVSGKREALSAEIARVLAPNGVAMAHGSWLMVNGKKRELPGLQPLTINHQPSTIPGGWLAYRKPVPAGMGEWTHWLCGPDNAGVCQDDLAVFPRELQWHHGPLWLKSHELIPALSTVVSAGGRIFYIIDESAETAASAGGMPEKWRLVALDAFNGVKLWQKPITEWGTRYWMSETDKKNRRFPHLVHALGGRQSQPDEVLKRLVAVGNKVFATLGLFAPVTALDAATGKEIRSYEGTEKTFEILVRDNTLVLAINHMLDEKPARGGKKQDVSIMAVDVGSGKILWHSKGYNGGPGKGHGIRPNHVNCRLTLGRNGVFFHDEQAIVALNLETGEELWKFPLQSSGDCALAFSDGLVFLSHRVSAPGQRGKGHGGAAVLIAVDAATGKRRWTADAGTLAFGTPPDIFVDKGLAWILSRDINELIGLDAATGTKKKTVDAKVISTGTHHNCYQNKAMRNFILYGRNKGVEAFDLNSGKVSVNKWVKGACSYGIIPANNMVYAPSHMCGCKMTSKLNGFVALTAASLKGKPLSDASAVTQGPAFDRKFDDKSQAGPGDWPIYRGRMQRDGFQPVQLPAGLAQKWTARLEGNLAPPIMADGKVFIAVKDRHSVVGLDAATGKLVWTFVAGGPIDSAPTWSAGRVVFGGRDGHVYCLDADSGKLVWRFRAAPDATQIVSFGQLESAWPVSGSLLVHNNRVYAPAGRATALDSGIALYMLDLGTGKPLKSRWLDAAVNSDILIGNGVKAAMRGASIHMDTLEEKLRGKNPAYGEEFFDVAGGMLDDSNYVISYWELSGFGGSILCTDRELVYGIHYYGRFTPLGRKSDAKPNYFPGTGTTVLFAGKEKKVERKPGRFRVMAAQEWMVKLPILAKSLVVAGDSVCVAGTRDIVDEKDPWAHIDGRKGAKLIIYSKKKGETQTEFDLASPPVFDGLASAHGSLLVSCRDGSVVCFGK